LIILILTESGTNRTPPSHEDTKGQRIRRNSLARYQATTSRETSSARNSKSNYTYSGSSITRKVISTSYAIAAPTPCLIAMNTGNILAKGLLLRSTTGKLTLSSIVWTHSPSNRHLSHRAASLMQATLQDTRNLELLTFFFRNRIPQ